MSNTKKPWQERPVFVSGVSNVVPDDVRNVLNEVMTCRLSAAVMLREQYVPDEKSIIKDYTMSILGEGPSRVELGAAYADLVSKAAAGGKRVPKKFVNDADNTAVQMMAKLVDGIQIADLAESPRESGEVLVDGLHVQMPRHILHDTKLPGGEVVRTAYFFRAAGAFQPFGVENNAGKRCYGLPWVTRFMPQVMILMGDPQAAIASQHAIKRVVCIGVQVEEHPQLRAAEFRLDDMLLGPQAEMYATLMANLRAFAAEVRSSMFTGCNRFSCDNCSDMVRDIATQKVSFRDSGFDEFLGKE